MSKGHLPMNIKMYENLGSFKYSLLSFHSKAKTRLVLLMTSPPSHIIIIRTFFCFVRRRSLPTHTSKRKTSNTNSNLKKPLFIIMRDIEESRMK